MHISDALINMEIREKKPAKLVKEALKSAFANAVNNHGMDADKLFVGARPPARADLL
jgi:ribosomal protein L22